MRIFVISLLWSLHVKVEGVTMSIVPSTVLLNYVPTRGDGQPVNTVFTCGGFTEMNVKYIQNLKIFRLTRNDLPGDTGLGPVVATIDAINNVPEIIMPEILSRATVAGNIDTLDWTQSNLVVAFETVQLQCKDEGMYTCEINYETNIAVLVSPMHSTNLTTNAQPADVSMTASKNGMQISTLTGTIDQPEPVTVGDTLQFKCTGLLGNLQDAKITWMRTSLSFTSDEFIDMNPGITLNDGNETAGAITELPDQCSRRQTNTLTYVIQNTDKSKPTLAFKCYIQATPPQSATGGQGGIKIIVNSTTAFYMKVDMGPQAPSTEAQTNNLAGAIAGGVTAGVLVTLVVLISIFVYLHRKGYIVKKKNKSAPQEHTYYNTSTKEKVFVGRSSAVALKNGNWTMGRKGSSNRHAYNYNLAFHSEESTSAGQSLEPAKYEDLSQNAEATSTYDTIEASLHADYDTRNEESTYEGLKQDMEPSKAYATLTQESRTNIEAESSNTETGSSTYNNLMLN